ncbi:M28 family peptidase [Micromonospora rubida]|uniref:M28 family peptidase n=1 Tax=Micromonospora rubida TaxID=2697657 RepID=A0ABW7SSX1_9ACTN
MRVARLIRALSINALVMLVAAGATSTVVRAAGSAPYPLADQLASSLTSGRLHAHLAALQAIADRSGGNRGYDRPGFARSAAYVTARLRLAGYQVTTQTVPYTNFEVAEERLVVDGSTAVPVLMTRFTPSTPAGGVDAPLAALPDGRSGCAADDYDGVSVAGAVVVLARAACGYAVQQQVVAALGARAMLLYYPVPEAENIYRFLAFDPTMFTIPMGGISRKDGEDLIGRAATGARVRLTLRGSAQPRTTVNLIAETAGGDPDNVVMLGAHLDSGTEAPGINDNGTAAVTVLQTALAMAPHQTTVRNKVRFAWWGAEEVGNLGSAYYVSQLSAADRARIAVLLNGELLASPNGGRFVWDAGSGGGRVVADLFAGYFERRNLPYERHAITSIGSDHLEFAAAGIAVGGIDTGTLGVKTPEQQVLYGGQAGRMFDPCYHQPCDTVGNLDSPALAANAPSLAWVTGRLATYDEDVRAAQAGSAATTARRSS